jgi:Ca-activated chloride channel homolog
MSVVILQQPHMLFLLLIIPVCIGLSVYAERRRRKALTRFIEVDMLKELPVSVSGSRRKWKTGIVLSAFVFIVFATSRPAWNLKTEAIERRGRDVAFLLDVSKSMLADDLKPNRLEHAKLAISDCINAMQGERVALVAFAGAAVVKCPLTVDYDFFDMLLRAVSPDSISRGGTKIGDAIRKTLREVLDDGSNSLKDIILLTDGEDHDSSPVEAAREAGKRGIRIISIGLGDTKEGRRIPLFNDSGEKTFLKYQGREVWTKLDAPALKRMVIRTPGGRYLNVSTGAFATGNVYEELIAGPDNGKSGSRSVIHSEETFQIFLGAALILLLLDLTIHERKKDTSNHGITQ